MTATASRSPSESMLPLADYLGAVLRGLRPLPPLDLDLTQAHGNTLAEDVVAPGPLPAFDHAAIAGYAARYEDVAAVEIHDVPKKGHGVRRAGDELPAGAVLAVTGTYITPALVAILSATGIGHVVVRPCPRVVVVATGDELVDAGRA